MLSQNSRTNKQGNELFVTTLFLVYGGVIRTFDFSIYNFILWVCRIPKLLFPINGFPFFFLWFLKGARFMGFNYVTDVVGHFQIHTQVLDIGDPTRRFVEKLKAIN